MMAGKFITLEGCEGTGKSTAIRLIEEELKMRGVDVCITREPGGTPFAEDVRELLLSPRTEKVDETAELLLFFAARSQHLHSRILPEKAKGKWVVSDRFTDSTYAYQGVGRGLGREKVQDLEQMVQGDVRPDAVILLDADPEEVKHRLLVRKGLDRMEQETLDFHRRAREGFLERARQDPERYHIVDATQSLEAVSEAIRAILWSLMDSEAVRSNRLESAGRGKVKDPTGKVSNLYID